MPLNSGSSSEQESSDCQNIPLFLDALISEYPEFEQIFSGSHFRERMGTIESPQDITHVSLSPSYLFLEEFKAILDAMNEHIAQKASDH